jgi:mRNA-degrading endonuclease RelE of RelBE toxin-antitoxin system
VAYEIEITAEAHEHLKSLEAGERRAVLLVIYERLLHEPTVETRNRKPMRPNSVAPWGLRVGRLRVYYDVTAEPDSLVTVRAIGIKDRNRVTIGGVEVDLS